MQMSGSSASSNCHIEGQPSNCPPVEAARGTVLGVAGGGDNILSHYDGEKSFGGRFSLLMSASSGVFL